MDLRWSQSSGCIGAHLGKGDLGGATHRKLIARRLAVRKSSSSWGEERAEPRGIVCVNLGNPMSHQIAVDQKSSAKRNPLRSVEVDSNPAKRAGATRLALDEKVLARDAARRLLSTGQLSTAALYRELASPNECWRSRPGRDPSFVKSQLG